MLLIIVAILIKSHNARRRFINISGREVTEEELDDIMKEKGNLTIFAQGIRTDLTKASKTLEDIEARHGYIVELEKSIVELHDLFVDMAMLGSVISTDSFNLATMYRVV